MASQGVSPDRLLDLPGPPEYYMRLALTQIERTSHLLGSLAPFEWHLPTVLPFWKVRDIVAHLYVLAGFYTSATPVIAGPLLRNRTARLVSGQLDLLTPVIFPSLHYSNIALPRVASRFLSQSTSVTSVQMLLEMLAGRLVLMPASRLSQTFPYFRWSVPAHLYVAVLAKELAVHRWEIEDARAPTELDPDVSGCLTGILWAAAPVYSRARRGTEGYIRTIEPGSTLTWEVRAGRVRPMSADAGISPGAVIAAAAADLGLAMMGRLSPRSLDVSGEWELARTFLAAFSYRAGPTPFFNP